ncbi:glycosyltransferase [Parafrankia elaeagni]|uniref:glycosyltransferase n=1 Tax=Parafrankia elaeagni TaxID=222534 RepID=UPI00035C2232|nr:glycosyltransferase [Parafrankia elaeagni]
MTAAPPRSAPPGLRGRRTPENGAADIVLGLAWETWADINRREFAFSGDRLFAHLYSSERVDRLMLVDAWRSMVIRLARRMLGGGGSLPFPTDGETSHLTPMRLRRDDSTDPERIIADYRRYDEEVARTARDRGLREPVLIATNPFHAAAAAETGRWRTGVFYCWDDFAAHPAFSRWQPALLDCYQRISRGGMPVVAVTEAIIRRIDPRGPALVLPNGVEPAEWTSPGPVPPWYAALPRPLLLYIGALGPRLDLPALEAMAEANPSGSVVLIGPCSDPEYLAPLVQHRNIHVRGQHPRAAVVAMTAAADVCLMPHVSSALTEAMSPLKLFEYLAAGRPVVATDLGPVRALRDAGYFGDAVHLARDPAQFVDQVARLLDEPAGPEAADFVARNSWARRFDELFSFVLDGPA